MSISTFTRRLKQAREKLELSQKRLGVLAGFDESVASARMNQYEKGKHVPDPQTVESLCRVLEVPVAFMYCEDDELALVVERFPHLNGEDKAKVMELIGIE